tara:strand:- start:443 stop:1225 length:783 start_codon:yes stop_codon:yes gene_type:complete
MNESISIYKIKRKNHVCGTCGKSFTRKRFYQQHIIACETLHRSQYKEICEKEERDSMPSQMDLYRMNLILMERLEIVEHKLEALTKSNERKKKKINIIEHLNNKHTDVILYDIWLQNLAFDLNQLKYTFKYKLVDGMYFFLQQNLPIHDNVSHPIKCFDQKRGIFFCMTEEGWIIMNDKDIIKCLRIVQSRLHMRFCAWKKEHKTQYDNDIRFSKKIDEYQGILLGGNMEEKQWINRVKNKLYNYLKCDLKETVEYDFVF